VDLRLYLRMLERQRWLIISTVVVVAVAAGIFATLQAPTYATTTLLLLRPGDPTEQLPSGDVQQSNLDLSRYVAGQAVIATSYPVAQAAAALLPKNGSTTAETPRQLLTHVAVDQSATSNVIGITARASTAVRAQALANAFANAYIQDRKAFDVSRLQGAVAAVGSKLTALQTQIDALSRGGPPTPGSAQAAALNAATTQYAGLLGQQQTLQVEINLKHGEAEIISPAELPAAPANPGRLRVVLLGIFAGLFLGIALALFREQLDSRIGSEEEAEELTGLPLLGQIPVDAASRGSKTHLIMRDHSTSAAAESIRALRTAVQLRHDYSPESSTPVPFIVVSSAGPGEGKSLVAANLAAAFAEAGLRTLLVSGDLRNPRVESMFQLSQKSPGLGDFIRDSNAVAVGSVVVATGVRNLFLLMAGAAVSNPAGVFTSEPFQVLMDHVVEHVDVVVFDTPPVLAATDATVMSAMADEVLLVVADNETTKRSALRARSILEAAGGSSRLGLVVNKVPPSSSSFDSYFRPVVR